MKINFQKPDRFEWALFIIAGLALIVFDWTQNMFQSQNNWDVMLWGIIPAITLFWVTFVSYHVLLFIAYARAIRRRTTSYVWDWVMGSFAFAGMFFLLVGGIGAMYYQPQEALPFFFNFKQIDVWHFGGIVVELLALGYFIITD